MDPHAVNPKYASLPNTAKGSEVLTSKYQPENSRTSNMLDDAVIIGHAEHLGALLHGNGIAIHDENLEVFGEVMTILSSEQNFALNEKFVQAILSFGLALKASSIVPSTLLESFAKIAESLANSTYEMRAISSDLKSVIPRKMLKASKKVDKKSKGKGGEDGRESGNSNEIPMEQDDGPATQDIAAQQMIGDLSSNINKRNREILIKHYSSDEFSSLDQAKADELAYYYLNKILAINNEALLDPQLYSALVDLTDKTRLMTMLRQARTGTLTQDILLAAIEELHDAINASGGCFGPYTAIVLHGNGQPALDIIISKPAAGPSQSI